MAIKRRTIDGFGQIELNNVAFRRDGRIEAQCFLDATTFDKATGVPAENGMLLMVNKAARNLIFPDTTKDFPVALNYSAEHMYDEREVGALKNFRLYANGSQSLTNTSPAVNLGLGRTLDTPLPRLGYLAIGDAFTTNCICYDSTEFANDTALSTALVPATLATTPIYGGVSTNGAILLSATAPTAGPVLLVVKETTMPDGSWGVKLHCISE